MCIDLVYTMNEDYYIYGIVDNILSVDTVVSGVVVKWKDENLQKIFLDAKIYDDAIPFAIVGVGEIYNSKKRQIIYDNLSSIGYDMINLIHNKSIIDGDEITGY